MKTERIKLLAAIAGALLFNFVFWHEKMALNTVLYDVFLLVMIFFLYPEARRVSTVRWLTLGHLICLAMILLHNTLLSKIAFMFTLSLVAGFAEYIHRSVWYAGGTMIMNVFMIPATFFESAMMLKKNNPRKRRRNKILRFAIIPLLLALVFFIIYAAGNSVFLDLSSRFGETLGKYFERFFDLVSFPRIMFLLAGLYLTAWIIFRNKENYFEKKEQRCKDDLVRHRKTKSDRQDDFWYIITTGFMGRLANGAMALKNMNTIGLISLVLLNLLLLVINIIDVRYIWFGFEYKADLDLYKLIHEGTDLLIISILLAIAVLMIFFQGNLNFYNRNKWLKYGAYLWIVQNVVLVISVLLRDYYYINQTGLAYKRIGVLFYLALVLVGLITVFWKIYTKKTAYYLFRVNAWAVIILLVASTTINWDEFIASYNIKRKDKILMPVDYMLTLSNKALPVIDQNIHVLKEQYEKQRKLGFITYPCDDCFKYSVKRNQELFMKQQSKYTWLSFNLADASVKKYYESKEKLTAR